MDTIAKRKIMRRSLIMRDEDSSEEEDEEYLDSEVESLMTDSDARSMSMSSHTTDSDTHSLLYTSYVIDCDPPPCQATNINNDKAKCDTHMSLTTQSNDNESHGMSSNTRVTDCDTPNITYSDQPTYVNTQSVSNGYANSDACIMRSRSYTIESDKPTRGRKNLAILRDIANTRCISNPNINVADDVSYNTRTSGNDTKHISLQNQCQEIENKLLQLDKLMKQMQKVAKAKEVAFEQAGKNIKQRTTEKIKQIRLDEERLIGELWVRHQRDMDTLHNLQEDTRDKFLQLHEHFTQIRNHLQTPSRQTDDGDHAQISEVEQKVDRLRNHLPSVIWDQRSVVRFIADDDPPRLGILQECFMTEDYNRVTKLRVYSFRNNQLDQKPTIMRRAKSATSVNLIGKEITCCRKDRTVPAFLFKMTSYGKELGQIRLPIDVTFLPNKNLLVAEYGNNRLQEIDRKGRPIQILASGSFKPRGVTLTREGYVAVLDEREKIIKVLTRSGEPVCRFGTGYFKQPSALSATTSDCFVLIDTWGAWQQSVIVYNPMTGDQKQLGYDKSGNCLLSHPEYIAVDHRDRVIISDDGNHCIWIFDQKGKLIKRMGQQGDGDGQLSYPKGVCATRDEILVADSGNHRISVFTYQGAFVRQLLTKNNGLQYPLGIRQSDDGVLVILQSSEIIVFET